MNLIFSYMYFKIADPKSIVAVRFKTKGRMSTSDNGFVLSFLMADYNDL